MANDLKDWKIRKALADNAFKDKAEENIKLWREYYRGNQWLQDTGTRYKDKVVVNMVYSNIKTIMPSINLRNPKYFISAKKKPFQTPSGMFDTNRGALFVEILLNHYFRELKLKQQYDKCLLDALIGPWGVMQYGYTVKTEKIKNDETLEVNELIKSESPFAIRRSPLDLRVDPAAMDSTLADARWVALRWVKDLHEVKNNPKYKNVGNLKANFSLTDQEGLQNLFSSMNKNTSQEVDPTLYKMVEGWDIWDKRDGRLMTMVEGHNKWLRDEDWPLDFEGFPVETLYFNENPDELYPVSDVDIILAEQDELNRIRALQLDHIRRISQRKYLTQQQSIDEDEIEKLMSGGDGTVGLTNGNPENAMLPLRDAPISQDLYIVGRQIQEDIRNESGISQFEQGGVRNFDTATEPALIQQGINIRRDERTSVLEDFYERGARQIAKILQQTLKTTDVPLNQQAFEQVRQADESDLAKIAGAEGAKMLQPWVTMDKDDIQGEYEFDIEVGSTRPVNETQRRNDALQVGQALQGNPYIREREGTKRFLEAFDVKDLEGLLKSEEEVQQQQQAAQKTALEAEIAKDQPKIQNDLQKTAMKSETSMNIANQNNATSALIATLQATGENKEKKD